MADPDLSRPAAREILKAVFWNRWGKVVGAVLAVIGVLDFVDAHFAPRFSVALKDVWDLYYVLPSFSLRTWIVIIAISLLVVAVHGAYVFAMSYSKRYKDLTAHRIIPHVMRESSQVYLGRWMSAPVVKANIALKFENIDSTDVTLKDISVILYERGTRGWKGWVRELPIRGPKPDRLYEKPMKLWEYDDPSKGVRVAGLRIKSRDFPSDAYFYLDDRMVFDDYVQPTNGIHFLRLTVEAVAQRPYLIDIEVDWTQPGLWILSSTPVFDTRKTIRLTTKISRVSRIKAKLLKGFIRS